MIDYIKFGEQIMQRETTGTFIEEKHYCYDGEIVSIDGIDCTFDIEKQEWVPISQ